MGSSETLIIENGALKLVIWQGVYFCEFDRPRDRKLFVKIIGDLIKIFMHMLKNFLM